MHTRWLHTNYVTQPFHYVEAWWDQKRKCLERVCCSCIRPHLYNSVRNKQTWVAHLNHLYFFTKFTKPGSDPTRSCSLHTSPWWAVRDGRVGDTVTSVLRPPRTTLGPLPRVRQVERTSANQYCWKTCKLLFTSASVAIRLFPGNLPIIEGFHSVIKRHHNCYEFVVRYVGVHAVLWHLKSCRASCPYFDSLGWSAR